MSALEARGLVARAGGFELRVPALRVAAGETHAILGASGSGKSTLLRALARLIPCEGEVMIDGASLAPLAHVRRVGLVQQRPGLLRMSALENVAFPLRARGLAADAARACIERVGLAHRAHARPHELSGGEAQRVAIARAVVARPDVILLDEATNQLDPVSVRLVEDLLKAEAARGAAIVIVTHSVQQARRLAARATMLSEGRVVAQGSVDEVLASEAAVEFVRFA